MKIKLLLAAVCIFILPLWASPSLGERPNPAPFASIAIAGHVLGADYACGCETPGCIEDYPGECGGHNTNQQSTSSDLGSGTLLILAALLLGLKFRA